MTVFEAAMGPMIGASTWRWIMNSTRRSITLMVGIGIPLSFLTVPAWWHLLNFL